MFGAKNIAVEATDPLPSTRRHVQEANSVLNAGGYRGPVELRILVDHIRRRFVAKLPVQTDFLELVEERIGLFQIMRVAKLTGKVKSAARSSAQPCSFVYVVVIRPKP